MNASDTKILDGLKLAARRWRIRNRKREWGLQFDDQVFIQENLDAIIELCETGAVSREVSDLERQTARDEVEAHYASHVGLVTGCWFCEKWRAEVSA